MCRWCGLPIRDETGKLDRTKRFCGPVCQTHHQLRADPKKMREHIFFRDQGVCQHCGKEHRYLDDDWEADHIVPLMVAFSDPNLWEPDNIQCLCQACHKQKSAEDRIKYRREYRRNVRRILDWITD